MILFKIENLVFRARSVFDGFAGKDCEVFWGTGVLEYWSVGKNESPNFRLNESFHYSLTPPLHHSSKLPQGGKTIEATSGGNPKPGPSGPGSLLGCGPVFLCCPLSFRPAQDRSHNALWLSLFFDGLRTTIGFELLHATTSLNSFLEALPQVITIAAVFLWLDDAVLIPGHTVFRNTKARRPAIRHILHSKGRESVHQVKLSRRQKPL